MTCSAGSYKDTLNALLISGSATSMYMQNFWGHDENLMYYRNHVYPLMSAGWGSTADYILLSDNDTIDLAMFSNWSFWTYGAFAALTRTTTPPRSVKRSHSKRRSMTPSPCPTAARSPLSRSPVSM